MATFKSAIKITFAKNWDYCFLKQNINLHLRLAASGFVSRRPALLFSGEGNFASLSLISSNA